MSHRSLDSFSLTLDFQRPGFSRTTENKYVLDIALIPGTKESLVCKNDSRVLESWLWTELPRQLLSGSHLFKPVLTSKAASRTPGFRQALVDF